MTSERELPSRFYRTAVRQLCRQYTPTPGKDPDEDLLDYLQSNYEEAKTRLEPLTADNRRDPDNMARRGARFVFAAGLLAYGRLDVAEDLLDCLPSSGGIRKLALALKALLPLPEELHPLRDPEGVWLWLRRHRDRLQWSEEVGVYEMRDDER